MVPKHSPDPANHPPARPWFLTALMIGLVIFSSYQYLKFIQVVRNLPILSRLDLEISSLYLGLESLLWGSSAAFLTWSILTAKPRSSSLGTALSLLYTLYFWIDQIFIAQLEVMKTRWPVNLVFTGLGLAGMIWSLYHPASRRYFAKNPVKIP